MNTKRKVTWKEVYDNFKSVYPNLSKGAVNFRPYNYMSILVYFENGNKILYDDITKRAIIIAA